MDRQELMSRIEGLSIWRKGDQRAPHKPLLILYALGQLRSNNNRYLKYEDVKSKLKELLMEFGPLRKSYHPEHPFVRLSNDGIWELDKQVNRQKFTDKQLLQSDIAGGFTNDVYSMLVSDPALIQKVAQTVLELHFPDSIHEDILNAVGLDFSFKEKKARDPKFREKILRAYGYSCAICGFNVRLAHTLVGVEAAHIKWHQAGGPDTEENGIALCSLHHKLFDRGVFTISNSRQMIVSQDAHGTHGFNEWLMKYHGTRIREPIEMIYTPNQSFTTWHVREVFRGPERYTV
ncbi:restriction endonuclease [Bacillus sp. HMF5848]|uniref:phosphorothioated DNA-binding restriction endonuclease n=1 Tax=Bacillus sp. HMF5848 TaxID=2495421 RepID=UPI000F76CE20|nr:HNH endonuclease [Bacillus sp. HMF5848]RSK27604.1 restriction endonuclease [Bacillus sp. HMF5848]